jgi:biopolymer transport protein TolQ
MSLFVKFIVFILFLMSVWTWGIFIEKLTIVRIKQTLSASFDKEYTSGEMLDKIYNRLADKKVIHAPYARIFYAGMKELTMSNIKNLRFTAKYAEDVKQNIRERIVTAVSIERTAIINEIKKNISSLATCGSLAPFIGLLGTVWGIIVTFRDIADAKILNLATVLPGIAEALFATVIGLGAAIPAIFFYNSLMSKLNFFSVDSEVFGLKVANSLSRELDIISINQKNKQIDEMKKLPDPDDDDDDD